MTPRETKNIAPIGSPQQDPLNFLPEKSTYQYQDMALGIIILITYINITFAKFKYFNNISKIWRVIVMRLRYIIALCHNECNSHILWAVCPTSRITGSAQAAQAKKDWRSSPAPVHHLVGQAESGLEMHCILKFFRSQVS